MFSDFFLNLVLSASQINVIAYGEMNRLDERGTLIYHRQHFRVKGCGDLGETEKIYQMLRFY